MTSADPTGKLLAQIDERIRLLLRRHEAVLATIVDEDPLTVLLDTGQAIEEPFVFGGSAPANGDRVVALWLQGGHDVGLVVGGGTWIPPFSFSGFSGVGPWETPAWFPEDDIDVAGMRLRASTRVSTGAATTLQLKTVVADVALTLPGGSRSATVAMPNVVIPANSRMFAYVSAAGVADLTVQIEPIS